MGQRLGRPAGADDYIVKPFGASELLACSAAASSRLLGMLDNEMLGAVASGGITFSLPLTGLSNLVLATITYNQGASGDVMETAKKAGARAAPCSAPT